MIREGYKRSNLKWGKTKKFQLPRQKKKSESLSGIHQRLPDELARRTKTQQEDFLRGWYLWLENSKDSINIQREIKHRSNKRPLIWLSFMNPQMQSLQWNSEYKNNFN